MTAQRDFELLFEEKAEIGDDRGRARGDLVVEARLAAAVAASKSWGGGGRSGRWVRPGSLDTHQHRLGIRGERDFAFFIDLHKAERDYSPTTMYRDYAISRDLFHWESQSRQHEGQPTVQRYIDHEARGTRVLLFVRERKRSELGTAAFTFLGSVNYVEHKGERPVAFTWRLPVPMPESLFEAARSVAAA